MQEVNNYNPSAKVMQILNAYANRALRRNIFEDCWTRLLVSAAKYWVELNAGDVVIDDKVFEILKDYIFDMNEEFESQELEAIFEGGEYTCVIEYCCNMFDKDILLSDTVQHSQPRELTKFICDIITQDIFHKFKDGSSVYMPFAGYCSEVVNLDNKCQYELGVSCEVDTDEISHFSWAISMLRLEANGLFLEDRNTKANILQGDSFANLAKVNKRYDYVIFTPPFGLKSQEGYDEYDAVRMAIDNKLADGGTLCCVLPAAFLTSAGKASNLRAYLLQNGYIDTLISLPKVFAPITKVSPVVLVARKQYQAKVKLIDGTRFITPGRKENGGGRLRESLSHIVRKFMPDYCTTLSLDDVKYSNNLLIPQIALSQVVKLAEGERLYQLRDITSFTSSRQNKFNEELRRTVRYSIRRLFDAPYNCDVQLDPLPLSDDLLDKSRKEGNNIELVDTPALVAQIVGSAVKVGKIPSQGRVLIQCKRNTLFFNANSDVVIPEFLLSQLQSDYVTKQVEAFLLKSGVPSIVSVNDLLDIRVVIPAIEQQRDVIIRDMAKDIYALNIELERNFENYKKDIHTRKHALVQSISSLSSHWNVLNSLRKRNNGIIDCSSMIGIANPVSVSSKFDSITNLITSISKFVEHLADVDYYWGPEEEINISSFVDEYITKNETHNYLMYNSSSRDNDEFIIMAPVRAVEQVFQNIISNAAEHGFTDSSRLDYKINFDVYEENGNVVVLISNNGNPLSNDVTEEMVLTDGFSTALNENGHQGIGGNEIKTIMSELGKVEVLSNPAEAFPVCYKLTFKKTNLNY